MNRDILYHFSVIVVRPSSSGDLLLGIYDNTYPLEIYRNRVNFFGGNQHPEDQSPLEIIQREIREEFVINSIRENKIESVIELVTGRGLGAQAPKKFAPLEDIQNIRDALLSTCTPYKDFLINAPHKHIPRNIPHFLTICSSYEATLDNAIFECARKNLANGKAIKSEGFATVVSVDDIVSGKVLSAGGSPVILADYLQKDIPDPYGLTSEILGKPRGSLADYEDEFKYLNIARIK